MYSSQNLYRSFRRIVCLSFLTLCVVAVGLAQTTTSTLTGEVRDTNGAVLAGAQVTARHNETGLTRTTVSTEDGRFVFPGLPLGDFEITVERTGFQRLIHKDVRLSVGETLALNLTMLVAQVTADVEVTGGEALVNTQSQELSYLVSERAIKELPLNGRNYTDLASLQPGVIPFSHRDGGSVVAHGLGMSINGQDPRSNVYLLDGTPQNDFTNGPAGSAAGTALGLETIREFRVETNAYSAEYGRNSGGQINIVSKSGTNNYQGSLYYFHRNDNLDARNFFDQARKPEFKRNQFGASIGGPIRRDKLFFFFGYEGLRENLGRTISTVVPDENARRGILPSGNVTVSPAVRPYLDEIPLPNGANLGGGLAQYSFGFNQKLDQNFAQFRFDYNRSEREQFFARYTIDDANQRLPTDFPQFPRSFLSRNQFFTGEYRLTMTPRTLSTFRIGYSRTRIGQDVESNVSRTLQPFVPGRDLVGDIDIGGMPRFGPQSSANLRLTQNIYNFEYGLVHSRGRHLIKAGALAEHYRDNMYNPTFSLGIYTFSGLRDFLLNSPQRFIGLTPEGAFDRHWRFTLFGFYAQDTYRASERLSLNLGVRYEFTTMPLDTNGYDSSLPNLTDPAPTVGPLYRNPTLKNISPRVGFAWDVFGDGRTSVRAGYGIYFNTNNQQNLIVTVTNPPATPRPVINNPTFPVPSFRGSISVRPVQFNLDNPYVQVWNLNIQRELWFDTVITLGYAGSRGVHLLRSGDVNVPTPQLRADGTIFYPPGQARPNPAFTTIELKSSDGDSWYNAMILELRKRWSHGFNFQSSYTLSRNIDTTQASTFFSDATNGTTSAFPEPFGLEYNKGLADYHAKHTFVFNFIWEIPFARNMRGVARKLLDGWQMAGIGQMRSGNPLTVFVQRNRSRSQWSPSLGPGIGQDRASFAPGFTHDTAVTGDPNRYFNPAAFVLQPAGMLGNVGRGSLIGPNLRTFDLAMIKNTRLGERTGLQLRIEAFNVFNRTNFGPPLLTAFTGATDNEQPVSSFGLIRSTVTSSRQIQLGLRITF
jgi:outer membrane receptor protein involved in Fe transport